jgi:hypothetical protein
MTVAVVAVTASIAQWLVQGLWKFFLPDEFKKVTEKLEDKFEQLKREMVDLQLTRVVRKVTRTERSDGSLWSGYIA